MNKTIFNYQRSFYAITKFFIEIVSDNINSHGNGRWTSSNEKYKGDDRKKWNMFLVNNHFYHRNYVGIQDEEKCCHGLWITQGTSDFNHMSGGNFIHGVYHVSWYTNMKGWWDGVLIEAGVDRSTTINVFLKIKKISYCWKWYNFFWLTLFSSWMSDIPSVMAWRISGCFLYIDVNAGCSSSCFKTKVFWKEFQNYIFKMKRWSL